MSVNCGGRTTVKIFRSSGVVFGFFEGSERSRERELGILEERDLADDAERLSGALRSPEFPLLLLEASSVEVLCAESCAPSVDPELREGSS